MNTKSTPLTGTDLIEAILGTGMISTHHLDFVVAPFTTSDEDAFAAAQQVLIDNEYVFRQIEMVENRLYSMWFMSPGLGLDHHPYHVTIELYVRDLHVPDLALMFFLDGKLERWGNRSIYGTGTSEAEKLVFSFENRYPGYTYFWVPMIKGSPIVDF